MKLMAMLIAVAGVSARAGALEHPVIVCMDPPQSVQIRFGAERASKIMAQAGVQLEWHRTNQCPSTPDTIRIDFSYQTPSTLKPKALAYAMPFEGTHIVVFYDRMDAFEIPHSAKSALIGYVMAHEITHILQGYAGHSATGIMKANWTYEDHFEIQGTLAFDALDVRMIQTGVAKRTAGQVGMRLLAAR